jgi:hypothetical protein
MLHLAVDDVATARYLLELHCVLQCKLGQYCGLHRQRTSVPVYQNIRRHLHDIILPRGTLLLCRSVLQRDPCGRKHKYPYDITLRNLSFGLFVVFTASHVHSYTPSLPAVFSLSLPPPLSLSLTTFSPCLFVFVPFLSSFHAYLFPLSLFCLLFHLF